MVNMLVTAVQLGFMQLDAVPTAFLTQVKKGLGIVDPVPEEPVEDIPQETENPEEGEIAAE
ncbi:hypothetical protein E2329_22935 [Salmonella enterica subsp. enterica]|nr:hypothetical protein [Salmonella enterica subsp. enterica serovar Paratyphi A]